ncbi:hypothetical protein [Vreelandella titanicae]|uniref:Uncharacterized protein n=1 Tax=Vreelandella titanicae TaxID=664683 RepID=A0A558J578_9GAMM|nr:hypothetical protein [Halomonas titanicae]TVU88746.1 hypothetical protein FQP89_17030 [Halomonas titanicae]
MSFKERIEQNLAITSALKNEPWQIAELDLDPKILSALIAYHADVNPNGYIGGHQETSVRDALKCLLESELNKRSAKSSFWLTCAGFAVSLAGFGIAAVQIWLAVSGSGVAG